MSDVRLINNMVNDLLVNITHIYMHTQHAFNNNDNNNNNSNVCALTAKPLMPKTVKKIMELLEKQS